MNEPIAHILEQGTRRKVTLREDQTKRSGAMRIVSSLIQKIGNQINKIQLFQKRTPEEILNSVLNPEDGNPKNLLIASFIREVLGDWLSSGNFEAIIKILKSYHSSEVLFYLEGFGKNSLKNSNNTIDTYMLKDVSTADQARMISNAIYSLIINLQESF